MGNASRSTADQIHGDFAVARENRHVCVWFLMHLIEKIECRQSKYLFIGPESLRMETVADLWGGKLLAVFPFAADRTDRADDGDADRIRYSG